MYDTQVVHGPLQQVVIQKITLAGKRKCVTLRFQLLGQSQAFALQAR